MYARRSVMGGYPPAMGMMPQTPRLNTTAPFAQPNYASPMYGGGPRMSIVQPGLPLGYGAPAAQPFTQGFGQTTRPVYEGGELTGFVTETY